MSFLRLCVAIIVGLPAATPSEFKNSAKVALWDFYNGRLGRFGILLIKLIFLVNGWPNGYAFILSFLAPLWTICTQLPYDVF